MKLCGAMVALSVLILSSACAGEEAAAWPQFRGPRGDGISAETSWTTDWAAGAKILWKARVGNGYAAVSVAAGKLYTTGNKDKQDTVRCLDALTGVEIWRFSYPAEGENYPGPRATPTVDGSRVYAVSRHALLHCLDAGTGEVIWKQDLTKTIGARFAMHGYASSPVVFENLLIVEAGAKDGPTPAEGLRPAGAAVAALDKTTGALVWKSGEGRPGYSTPMLYEKDGAKRIAMFMADGLLSLDAKTGRQIWRFPYPVKLDHAIVSPIISGDLIFISAGYGTGSVLVDASNDAPKAVWRSMEFANQFATSVLHKGFLYGFDGDNEHPPALKCVELATGKVMWSKDGMQRGSVTLASQTPTGLRGPGGAGDRLIIQCGAGDLCVAEATPEGYKELARAKVLAGVCWTAPVLANGLIYCRTQDGVLVCVDARGPGK